MSEIMENPRIFIFIFKPGFAMIHIQIQLH